MPDAESHPIGTNAKLIVSAVYWRKEDLDLLVNEQRILEVMSSLRERACQIATNANRVVTHIRLIKVYPDPYDDAFGNEYRIKAIYAEAKAIKLMVVFNTKERNPNAR